MTATTYELLPTDRGRNLPVRVICALADLGVACNEASIRVGQADLMRSAAIATEEGEIARRRPTSATRRAAQQSAASALSYSEQLTVVYTGVATAYAAYAAQVFTDVAAGQEPSAADRQWPKPSQLIADVNRYAPLLQIPDPSPQPLLARVIAEQNAELSAAHDHLVTVIEQRMWKNRGVEFDDPASVAHREAGATDLVAWLPAALHRYAATATWVVGLMADTSAQTSALA